jgi:HEAT repeat protein
MRPASVALLALAALPIGVGAQPLARRVAALRDGEVRLAFAPRSGVCGDGKDVIIFGDWFYVAPSMEGHGHTHARCVDGPVRVAITVGSGIVTAVRTSVGGSWRGGGRASDLGLVPAADAGSYFLSLAGTLQGKAGKEALLAGVLADSTDAVSPLSRLVGDEERPLEIRRRAVRWLGAIGGADVVPTIDAIARDGRAPRDLREGAVSALAESDSDEAVSRLIRLSAETTDTWLARKAIFWLGQTRDDRAHETLRSLVRRESADDDLRAEAIFALGHGSASSEDAAFLRGVYSSLKSGRLKEKIIQSIAQIEGEENVEWLLSLALDGGEALEQRKKAFFWAGQSDAPGAPIVKAYDRLNDRELKEHAIFVLSQRDEDDASLDKLIDIARRDPDHGLRRKAIFWLGQSDDPRAHQLIRDLVTK